MNTNALVIRESPDIISAIDNAPNLAESTRTKYRRAVELAIAAGVDLFDAESLVQYSQNLSDSGRSFLKAALRLTTEQIANGAKAQATPDNVDAVQAVVYRVEALQEAIQVSTPKGTKAHTWLSQAQVKQLLDTCDDTLSGKRDRLALGLLVAAGLRRSEAAALTLDDIKLQPVGDRIRAVLDIVGKGQKRRTVPISDALANALDEWSTIVGGSGRVLRSFDRRREFRDSLSAVAIFNIVREHGARIGKPELACHDLRRSYAQIGLSSGVPVTQISTLLGHASLKTTQKYLNLELDLESSISDFVPF